MQDAINIPSDMASCQALILQQASTINEQASQISGLNDEMEKLKKLLIQYVNGHRSEKRVLSGPEQKYLPFENDAEYQAARAEAEAEAQAIIQTFTVTRKIRKRKRRDESFPAHIPRQENLVEAPESVRNCPSHGPRTLIGYDTTETLVRKPAELLVIVNKYPKYACATNSECGIQSPERPTSLVEGNRYDTSVAATIIEGKWFLYLPIYRQQDVFAGSGWTPSRSTLLNIIDHVEFVIDPFLDFMKQQVQADGGVGTDDTSCRMLIPKVVPPVIPGDAKSKRLAEKIAEALEKKQDSLIAKMWVYCGLHKAPYNIFDFRVSRHRDGPDEFFKNSRCTVLGDCFSGNKSVVVHSDGRLEFAACWSHARRKVVEALTYKDEADTLVQMIQALYDIETRAKEMSWQERQDLRMRESTIVLAGMKKWLDSLVVLPKSDFADAIGYIHNQWPGLNVFVRDGKIPIDNNTSEQLMKQVALGRKAWLFVGNVPKGEQSAKMMSLVSSARRHDLDVFVYVKELLDQLLAGSTDYHSLLPDVWKQRHPEAIREYRVQERRDKAERKQIRAAERRVAAN